MFAIKYEILDEGKNRLSNIKNIKEFELEFNSITGQIQLICNDKKIGFVDKEIPYEGEFLLIWLQRLNEVIIHLNSNSFVTMSIPDSANIWLEFKAIDNMILITKIRAKKEMHVQEFILNMPKEKDQCFWNEYILRKEFVSIVLESTDKFIKELASINEILLEAREVIELENLFQKAKELSTNKDIF